MALQAGQRIGNYDVVRLLGEGGFGEVYLVENPLIQRRAAAKVLHAGLAHDAESVRRFLNEARAASAIRHPNIIEVLDAGGTADGAHYILLEFLEGVSLQKRLADVGRLALPQVLDIASQAGSALAAAHAAGIVHRDLKPENLFLVPDASAPDGERVKVLDFGIAKIKHGSGSGGTVKTRTGVIMGSPAYMSPEQCKDSADVDLRSDVYSFAVILYETLTGRPPHVAPSGTELLIMHLTETPRPLRELAPDVPAHVEAAIARALARARDDRFNSMTSFVAALRGSGDTAILSQPPVSEARPALDARPALRSSGAVSNVERTAILPAAAEAARRAPLFASDVGHTAKLPADTTFSRATGEVDGLEDSDESLSAEVSRRRWPLFVVGGVAVAGLALFLLVRLDNDSKRPPATSTQSVTATSTETVESTGSYLPEPQRDAGGSPRRADAGAATNFVTGTQTGTKTALYTKTKNTASTKTRIDLNTKTKADLGTKTKTDSGTKTATDWDPFRSRR
jgi:serine/threonine protein kinase